MSKKFLDKIKGVDIIHGHNPVCFGLVLFKLKIPFLYTIHSLIDCGRSFKFLNYFLCKKANHITVVETENKNRIIKQFKISEDKISVILPGIDTNYFKSMKTKKTGKRKILFVGRNVERKGVNLIKNIEHLIKKEYKDVEFVYAFDVPWDKLRELYNECYVLLCPTLWGERITKVVQEAMSCGKPAISTICEEIIENNKTGILIKPNEKELYNAVSYVLDNEKETRKMGKKARQSILKYDWKNIAKSYLSIYNKLANK